MEKMESAVEVLAELEKKMDENLLPKWVQRLSDKVANGCPLTQLQAEGLLNFSESQALMAKAFQSCLKIQEHLKERGH